MRDKERNGSSRTTATDRPEKREITFRLGELYCGPGGLALGALRAKVRSGGVCYCIQHAWANDYDADSCSTYRRNICPSDPDSVLCLDVRRLDLEGLPPIDGFAYGFPCNDFSIVGEHHGINGTFGSLYRHGVRVIDMFRPRFFVAENVGGITSANEGKAFQRILSDLRKAGNGYNLTVHLYRFEEYGIPQTRHRLIIVGVDQYLGLVYKVPAPTTLGNPIGARQAIEVPPFPAEVANNERTVQSPTVVERLKRTKPGENAWTADLPEHLRLNVKNTRLSQIYKRLHPDRPSYTITGSGGGGTHGYHWDEPRALTNRERARLQTFPDDFVFEGSKESVRRQIGMAVPPMMAEVVFTALLKTMAGVSYNHIPPSLSDQTDLFDAVGKSDRIPCVK